MPENYSPVMNLQQKHCSVRKYKDEPIPEALLHSIIRSAQCAASTSFMQGYSVIRVTDPQARKTIAEAAGGQAWVEEAAEFMVLCADLYRVNEACGKVGLEELEGYTEHFLGVMSDIGILAQNIVLAAESVGLGGVFIGGIRNDPQCIVDTLQLPERVFPAFGLCLGWPDQECEVKPRMPLSMILHTDRYHKETVPADLESYDEVMEAYYRSRSENRKFSNWTAQIANTLQGKKRKHMLGFLQEQEFLKR